MPTGYTAKLSKEDQPFNEFVMTCARAMGACVMLRDEEFGPEIPEFQPSTHAAGRLAEEKAKLAGLHHMTATAQREYTKDRRAKVQQECRERLEEIRQTNARLDAMALRVGAWEPPTTEHRGLKDFMLDQLRISREDGEYHEAEIAESARIDYHAHDVDEAKRMIENYTRYNQEEIDRTSARNQWVRALRASLPTSDRTPT